MTSRKLHIWVYLGAFLLLCLTPSLAGEIKGQVQLVTKNIPSRKKNKNPNRKKNVKKYGLKAIRQAQAGGKGGLPKNEKVDERDFAVVFLSASLDGKKLKATPKVYEVRQAKRRFFNHVTALPLGAKVRFANEDKFFHHIYCPDASSMNVPEHRGDVDRKPTKLGKFELFCDIHPLMNAYVYVVPNDHFAISKNGKFSLKNVPPGNYELKVWHPRLKASSQKVTVAASKPTEVTIKL